jgi:hypothetical protein
MTEQELKTQIRKRIHRDLGVIQKRVWELYWNLSVVRNYLERHTGSEPDIMGADGKIYVDHMKTVLEMLNTATQRGVTSYSFSHNQQQPPPRDDTLGPTEAYHPADNVET